MKLPRKMSVTGNRGQAPWLALLALAALELTGCAVGPKYHPPVVQSPPAYKEVGDWKPAQPNDQNLGGDWWKIFQDPQLDALEAQVDTANQTLYYSADGTQASAITIAQVQAGVTINPHDLLIV